MNTNMREISPDEKKIVSAGSHGECFSVKVNGVAYILKEYSNNISRECDHECQIYDNLHNTATGKGTEQFFKGERVLFAGRECLMVQTYEGKTLLEYANGRKKTDLKEIIEIMILACEAISYMHKAGYIHLDIKPSNLYMSESQRSVKPIDMGSAVKYQENHRKSFNELVNEIGYLGTDVFATMRLKMFNRLRFKLSTNGEISEYDSQRLLDLGNRISPKDDICGLIYCFFYLITGKTILYCIEENPFVRNNTELIRNVLEQAGTPEYIIGRLVSLFAEAMGAALNENDEINYNNIEDLVEELQLIREVESNFGVHPEIVLKKSIDHYQKRIEKFDTAIRKDLLTTVESHQTLNGLVKHNKNIMLIGEGGSGKTYQLFDTYGELLSDESGKVIPLFVPLNGFDDSSDYIRSKITNMYLGNYLSREANHGDVCKLLIEGNESYEFYILLDGINETSSACPDKLYTEIRELAEYKNAHVIITSRYVIQLSDFEIFTLEKLDESFLCASLPKYRTFSPELKVLLRLPFYYQMYMSIEDDMPQGVKSELQLVHRFFINQIKKLDESRTSISFQDNLKALLFEFLTEYLCKNMLNSSRYLLVRNSELNKAWIEYNHGEIRGRNAISLLEELGVIYLYKDDTLHPGKREYAFTHEIYFEYFVSQYIEDVLKHIGEQVSDKEVYKEIDLVTDIISYYDDRYDKKKTYKLASHMINLLKRSSYGKSKDEYLLIAVARAYIVSGYALHVETHREMNNVYFEALTMASELLEKAKLQSEGNTDDAIRFRLHEQETILYGDLGAYYYSIKEYEEALVNHKKALEKRKEMYQSDEFERSHINVNKLIAVGYKNVGSDYYHIGAKAINNTKVRIDAMKNSFISHNNALKIYQEDRVLSRRRDRIICINRLLGPASKLLEAGELSVFAEQGYGRSFEQVVCTLLNMLGNIIDYFIDNVTIDSEIRDCIKKIDDLLQFSAEHNLSLERETLYNTGIFNYSKLEEVYREKLKELEAHYSVVTYKN